MIYKIKPYIWKVLRDGKVLFVAIFLALALAIPNIALAPPPPGPSPNLESRVTALEGAVATLQAQVEDLTGASLQTIVAVYILGADTSNPSVATATSFVDSSADVSTVTFLPGVFDPSKPLPRFFCQVYQASNLVFAHTLHIVDVQWNGDGSITVTVAIAEGGTFGNNDLLFSEIYSIVGIQ